jgi:hypothetical protein
MKTDRKISQALYTYDAVTESVTTKHGDRANLSGNAVQFAKIKPVRNEHVLQNLT